MSRTKPSRQAPGREAVRGLGWILRLLLCVAVGGLGASAGPGCGGSSDEGLTDDAVAEVGGTVITRGDFERALRFTAGRGHDPRDLPACVAAKRRGTGGAGDAQLTDAQLTGMDPDGAKNPAYQAAYRSCMRKSGF